MAVANFGDGYTQEVPLGINHVAKVYKLQWDNMAYEDSVALNTFLRDKRNRGVPFAYTYPGDIERQYKVTELNFVDNSPIPSPVTATFVENFALDV